MTSHGEVTLAWIAGEHKFNIAKLGLRLALESKCESGTQELFQRLIEGRARFNDIRETIRLGLIGGGMPDHEALQLVKLHVDECPRADNVNLAKMILLAEIVGVPGDQPGKKDVADRAAMESASSTMTADSSDPQSTASAQQSASRRAKSTKSRSGNSRPVSTGGTARRAAKHSPTP